MSDRKPAPAPLQLLLVVRPEHSSALVDSVPYRTRPGRRFPISKKQNRRTGKSSGPARKGKAAECHLCGRIKKRGRREALNQEFDKSRRLFLATLSARRGANCAIFRRRARSRAPRRDGSPLEVTAERKCVHIAEAAEPFGSAPGIAAGGGERERESPSGPDAPGSMRTATSAARSS